MSNNTDALKERGMITGTSNYDDVPHVPCGFCGGYYKADEPDQHVCQEEWPGGDGVPEIECDICGNKTTDPEGRHHCHEGTSND